MKEVFEFRILEKYAGYLFDANEGEKIGDLVKFVRKIRISKQDPKFKRIGELDLLIKKDDNDHFFYTWSVHRSYTSDELKKAELFSLRRVSTFEPAGEECGTQYDELSACPKCKSNARQVTPLFLDWKRIPRGKDMVRTIAGEIVISKRMVDLFAQHSVSGLEFGPVRQFPASSAESKEWYQLLVGSCDIGFSERTQFGINPFDLDKEGRYRCMLGDLAGFICLSEVFVDRASYNGSDIVASRQFIGHRGGLLRPERMLLISPKLHQIMEGSKLKGCGFEIAHLI